MTRGPSFLLLPAVFLVGCTQAADKPATPIHYDEVFISATGTPGEWEDTYLMIFEEEPSIAAFETIMEAAEKQAPSPSPTEQYDFTVTLADGEEAIAYHLWLPQDDGADGFIMYPNDTHTLHLVPYEDLQYALALLGVNQPTNTEEEGNS